MTPQELQELLYAFVIVSMLSGMGGVLLGSICLTMCRAVGHWLMNTPYMRRKTQRLEDQIRQARLQRRMAKNQWAAK